MKPVIIAVTLGQTDIVAVIKRWSANTGPTTRYGDFGAINLAVLQRVAC